jgi:hypothetical protein
MKPFKAEVADYLVTSTKEVRDSLNRKSYNQWLEEVFSNINGFAKQGRRSMFVKYPIINLEESIKLLKSLGYKTNKNDRDNKLKIDW